MILGSIRRYINRNAYYTINDGKYFSTTFKINSVLRINRNLPDNDGNYTYTIDLGRSVITKVSEKDINNIKQYIKII